MIDLTSMLMPLAQPSAVEPAVSCASPASPSDGFGDLLAMLASLNAPDSDGSEGGPLPPTGKSLPPVAVVLAPEYLATKPAPVPVLVSQVAPTLLEPEGVELVTPAAALPKSLTVYRPLTTADPMADPLLDHPEPQQPAMPKPTPPGLRIAIARSPALARVKPELLADVEALSEGDVPAEMPETLIPAVPGPVSSQIAVSVTQSVPFPVAIASRAALTEAEPPEVSAKSRLAGAGASASPVAPAAEAVPRSPSIAQPAEPAPTANARPVVTGATATSHLERATGEPHPLPIQAVAMPTAASPISNPVETIAASGPVAIPDLVARRVATTATNSAAVTVLSSPVGLPDAPLQQAAIAPLHAAPSPSVQPASKRIMVQRTVTEAGPAKASDAPAGAPLVVRPLVARTAPQVASDLPAPPAAAPVPSAIQPEPAAKPQDFAALIDRIVAAREASAAPTITVAVRHAEFGSVSLRFDNDASGLAVAMSSPDPDFARAVASALPSDRPAPVETAAREPGQPSSRGETASHSGTSSGSRQNNPSQREAQHQPRQSARHLNPGQPNQRSGIFA